MAARVRISLPRAASAGSCTFILDRVVAESQVARPGPAWSSRPVSGAAAMTAAFSDHV